MSDGQILAARSDPAMSAKAANWYAGFYALILQKAGILPTPANLTIAHALGGGGAAMALRYPDATTLSHVFKETQPMMADPWATHLSRLGASRPVVNHVRPCQHVPR